MPRPSSHELILDAYESLLIDEGYSSVTLNEVARRARVSKGGLLYNFGSKDALLTGMLERLHRRAEEDREAARGFPGGVVRYYLQTSASDALTNSPLHRTLVAAQRLVLDDKRVNDAIRSITRDWRELLSEETGDPLAASLITLLGDGLYVQAALGVPNRELLASLDEVVARLSGQEGRAKGRAAHGARA
ncbi:TetR/AcrR family transcriptional regulator [Streptomyces boncukensis]|uniref:TetR/AcrR family transcriptional regulator n=1 Tax=Streptomyces boncukensis TaxID=2711219 RepID=A0A6G4WY34_9ACTN|nr:TetR/AcrR family transcriptional regulator [Streptomyces boncukensis]NGO69772.1 TetR/AcrR family transcriptional regulator [Streptomyces boncukensis]